MESAIIVTITIFSLLLYYGLANIWYKLDEILNELKKKL
jgi:hypothetical protein